MEQQLISLDHIAGGAVLEKVNNALGEVFKNIHDPNTDYRKKRSLTLQITFETDSEREYIETSFVVNKRLAPEEAVTTRVIIGVDGKGNILGSELRKQVPGQQHMIVDTETGEILSDIPEPEELQKTDSVIDFRKGKAQ
jgi:hypothetical protein